MALEYLNETNYAKMTLMKKLSLNLDKLKHDPEENLAYGLNQEWYKTKWQRLSGCGPTAASTLIYSMTSQSEIFNREEALTLMDTMWKYVTPSLKGVYKRSMFTEGLQKYFDAHQLKGTIEHIEISKEKSQRPSLNEVMAFIETALLHQVPIAFLNLDNGEEKKLDEWHWVIISGLDSLDDHPEVYVHIIDDNKLFAIDIALWLKSTKRGGALVYALLD